MELLSLRLQTTVTVNDVLLPLVTGVNMEHRAAFDYNHQGCLRTSEVITVCAKNIMTISHVGFCCFNRRCNRK